MMYLMFFYPQKKKKNLHFDEMLNTETLNKQNHSKEYHEHTVVKV